MIDQVTSSYRSKMHVEDVNVGRQILWRSESGDLFNKLHRVADQDRQFERPTDAAMVLDVLLNHARQRKTLEPLHDNQSVKRNDLVWRECGEKMLIDSTHDRHEAIVAV